MSSVSAPYIRLPGHLQQARARRLPPEIAFLVQSGVAPDALDLATRRAQEFGLGADEVLIAEAFVSEDFYYRALAARLNCPFVDRAAALASGFDYRAALRAGVARADRAREEFDFLLAPRGAQIAQLIRLGAHGRIAICSPGTFPPWRERGDGAPCRKTRASPCRAPTPASAPARRKFAAATPSASP